MSTGREQSPFAATGPEPSRDRALDARDPRLVYGSVAQGLFQVALRGKLSEATRDALRAEGLDPDQDVAPAYPVTQWLRCLDVVVRDVWPGVERDEAWRQLGLMLIRGVGGTMVGRVMFATARAVGPRRALPQLHRGFGNSDNYLEVRARMLSERACEVGINDIVGRPTYYLGILEAILEGMGAREPRVTLLRTEGLGGTFLLEWAT